MNKIILITISVILSLFTVLSNQPETESIGHYITIEDINKTDHFSEFNKPYKTDTYYRDLAELVQKSTNSNN